jgi:succinoglycan biosynthesis transport protein ExoP
MNDEKTINLGAYVDIVYRYRLWTLWGLLVGFILTGFAMLTIPDLYRSSTLMMIVPQEVPAQYVAAPSAVSLRDHMEMLEKIALAWNHLEQVIKEYKLYPLRQRSQPMDNVLNYMKRHIAVEFEGEDSSRAGSGVFRLRFDYSNPRTAQRVTARLAQILINEDRKERARQSAATTRFLNDQLAKASERLASKDREMKVFKERFEGSLPQDLDSDLSELSGMQTEVETINEKLRVNSDRMVQLEREQAEHISTAVSTGEPSLITPQAQLNSMKTRLALLRAQYSDSYPDVMELKAQIEALEEEISKQPAVGKGRTESLSPLEQQFARERAELSSERNQLYQEEQRVRAEIPGLQTRIKEIPGHAQQLADLTRDYQVLTAHYNELLNHKLEAQMSQSLEERAEGERFQILDRASFSNQPLPPGRIESGILGAGVTLFLALGLPFALAFLDSSVKDPDELRRECNLPVVATIPRLEEVEGAGPRRALHLRAAAISAACLVVGIGSIWVYATKIV